jgi:biotin operon repressor
MLAPVRPSDTREYPISRDHIPQSREGNECSNYEQACGRGIADTFGIAQSQVQKRLIKLEAGGVPVSRLIGRTRLCQWNPRTRQRRSGKTL